jgi:cell volume regulation protein A
MFLVLGLLVFPSRLLEIAPVALLLAAFLTLVARPIVVVLCLLPFRYPRREVAYISAVGLRGAVPIVLASFPVLAGAPGASRVFDIVFFVVVVGAFIPGALVPWLAGKLHVERSEPPAPQAVMAIESVGPLDGELLSFYMDEALPVIGARLSELPFPHGAAVTLIIRGKTLVAPEPATELQVGDHVYVITSSAERWFVQLMFGRPESQH